MVDSRALSKRSSAVAPATPRSLRAMLAWCVATLALLVAAPVSAHAASGFLPATDLDGMVGDATTAAAPDGTMFVAWVRPGTPEKIIVAVHPPGGGWTAQDVATTTSTIGNVAGGRTIQGGVPIAVSGDGTATILALDPGGKTLRAMTRPPGGSFGNPVEISDGTEYVNDPSLAVNASGNAIAAWAENPAAPPPFNPVAGWTPRAAYRSAGGWGPTVSLTPTAELFAAVPLSVAINAAGRAAVGFTSWDGSNGHARATIRPSGGSFPVNATTLNASSQLSRNTTVAVTDAGATVAAYAVSTPPAAPDAVWRIAAPGFGTFAGEQQVSGGAGSIGTSNASQIMVAAGPGETVHAAWLEYPTDRVQYGSAPVSTGVVAGRTFLSPHDEHVLAPQLAIDAAGGRFVTWSNISSFTVQGVYRQPGAPAFGAVETISASGSTQPTTPSIARDAQGNAVVAWRRPTATGSIIQAAGYDVAPPSLTSVSFPVGPAAGVAAPFSASATDVWSSPALTWSFGDGSTAAGGAVAHAFGAQGAFTSTVTATDGVGNTTSASGPVTVTSAGSADNDHDGFSASLDCNDQSGAIHPGAREVVGNKVDENCDGQASGFHALPVGIELTWTRRLGGGPTRMSTLRVTGLHSGDHVRLKCKGTGCRKKAKFNKTLKKVKRGKLALTGVVAGLRLSPKASLTITVSRTDAVTKIIRYTMRDGKSPRKTTRCLAPGAKKTFSCS